MVVPPGRFPSCRIRPTGSLTARICARFMARQMMSLRWLWRCCLGALLLQAKPCRLRASTALPHTHVWGSHALHPIILLFYLFFYFLCTVVYCAFYYANEQTFYDLSHLTILRITAVNITHNTLQCIIIIIIIIKTICNAHKVNG